MEGSGVVLLGTFRFSAGLCSVGTARYVSIFIFSIMDIKRPSKHFGQFLQGIVLVQMRSYALPYTISLVRSCVLLH